MIYKIKLASAILLLLCLCLPLSGRYVDGPLVTVVKKHFLWDDFNPQETYSWHFLFAFIWPLMAIPLEHWLHDKRLLLGLLLVFEPIAAIFYSGGVIAVSFPFRFNFALIGTDLAWTALGTFSLCAIISFCQLLYSEVQRLDNSQR